MWTGLEQWTALLRLLGGCEAALAEPHHESLFYHLLAVLQRQLALLDRDLLSEAELGGLLPRILGRLLRVAHRAGASSRLRDAAGRLHPWLAQHASWPLIPLHHGGNDDEDEEEDEDGPTVVDLPPAEEPGH